MRTLFCHSAKWNEHGAGKIHSTVNIDAENGDFATEMQLTGAHILRGTCHKAEDKPATNSQYLSFSFSTIHATSV